MKANTYHAPVAKPDLNNRKRNNSDPDPCDAALLFAGGDADMGYLSRREQTDAPDTFGSRKVLSSNTDVSPQSVAKCIALVLKELILRGEEGAIYSSVTVPYRIFDRAKGHQATDALRRSLHSIRNSIRGSVVPEGNEPAAVRSYQVLFFHLTALLLSFHNSESARHFQKLPDTSSRSCGKLKWNTNAQWSVSSTFSNSPISPGEIFSTLR
jgi:hypothetical protein